MFCCKCGTEIPDEAVFCYKCGAKTPCRDMDEKEESIIAREQSADSIKPYYREQFERIASGERPKFNWAALFLSGWIQLYHGCTGIFCKTFLPLRISLFIVELISIVSFLNFNLALMAISSVLGIVVGSGSVVLSIMNGFKFNKWYYQDVVSNPGKKRSRKGLWILLISEIMAVMALTVFSYTYTLKIISDNFTETDTQAEYENVDLSKTYTNKEEGISFRYPSAWIQLSEQELDSYIDSDESGYPLVILANEIEDLPEENTYIMISKFNLSQADIDHLFIDDDQFAAIFDKEVSVKDTFITEVDGLPAREITYIDSDGIGYQSYFYVVNSMIYRIDFVWMGESSGNNQRFFDAIMDSYTIIGAGGKNNELADYKMAYAQKAQELATDDTMQFSLIYLTGSDIPELVAEHSGYDISIFAWVDGEIVTLMDQWAYGAGGNIGYEYLPENNVIRNYSMDYAGAVIYELYFTVNDACEVVELLDEELSIWYFRDFNGDGEIGENEYCDEPVYYYGDTEISEEEYLGYQVKGDFEAIHGELSLEEILAQL